MLSNKFIKSCVFTAFVLFFIASAITSKAQSPLLLTPSISPDGSEIAYSYQGDIWVVSSEGGTAIRLTIHESYESSPDWHPDGKTLVFVGSRHGNGDLFTVTSDGNNLQRKTYHSASDSWPQWQADGTIWFQTRRNYAQVERSSEIYRLDTDNATPYRAMEALGNSPSPNESGEIIAFERGACRVAREAYRGPANRDIWIYHKGTDNYIQVTSDEGQDYSPKWGEKGVLYFLSARSGKYQVYAQKISDSGQPEGTPTALTNRKDWGVRSFDVNAKGDLVYSSGPDVLVQPAKKKKGEVLKPVMTGDDRYYAMEKETKTSGVSSYALSPNEKMIAFVMGSDIFVKLNDKEKKRTIQLTNYVGRDENVVWFDDETLFFISDRGGKRDIYQITSADTSQPNLFFTLKHEISKLSNTDSEEQYMVMSNERDKLAIVRDRGTLVIADIDSNGVLQGENTLLDGWASPNRISWSPDDRWLAYDRTDLDFNDEVYILQADGSSEPVNVSMHPREDYGPVWSPDGSKLGFISDRNAFNADVWFVWLKKSDWEKTRYDWEGEEEEEVLDDKKDKKDEGADSVIIDTDKIYRRLAQVTYEPGSEGSIQISKDGKVFYYSTNNGSRRGGEGKSEFKQIDWDRQNGKTILSERVRGLQWDGKRKYLYYIKSFGTLSRLDPGSKKSEGRPFNVSVKIDKNGQREHVFEEAWSALGEDFYDPDFHGQDWNKLKSNYKPVAMSASTSQDFRLVFNEMLGQLNASHMGLYGSNPERPQRDNTGRLGADVVPGGQEVVVSRVIPNTPVDRTGSKLEVGDKILGVNGQPVTAGVNFYSLFDETGNDKVYLSVMSEDGSVREVVVRPTFSIGRELYNSWVEERRQLTDKYSNGKLGYIHIQGMNWGSFEVFERELTASGEGKEGVVIDVRYNGGGWTTDMLMAVLNTRQHAYTIPRGATESLDNHKQFENNYPYGERLPFPYLKVPAIALCNESSYSNAEIFSHAFKTLGHGTLVGQPTFGAVISTGGKGLIDGSFVRMPFRAWYVKATNENMELGPAVPDILVEDPPSAKGEGEDPQLKKAVEVLLGQLN